METHAARAGYGAGEGARHAREIYFKNESVSPAGSHKPNTAVPQAYYNYKQGIRRLTTETGAGQWGAAIAFAAKHFGIDLQVYMVKVSYDQKPYRRLMMNTWGAECIASPSRLTASGRAALERDRTVREASDWPFRRRSKWRCNTPKIRGTVWEAC